MHSENINTEKIEELYGSAVEGLDLLKLKNPNSLEWYNHIRGLPDLPQMIYCITVLENQVINGGFDQYFVNFYGQFSLITISFLEKIKAFEKAELLSKAYNIYNPEGLDEMAFASWITNKDWIKNLDVKNQFERADSFDKEYWNSSEDVVSLINQYIDNK